MNTDTKPQIPSSSIVTNVDRLRETWNAPKRHLATPLATLDTGGLWGTKYTTLKDMLGTGFLACLVGDRGTGKTQLGVELMRGVTAAGKSARYTLAARLFMDLKSTFRKDSESTENDVVDEYVKPRLLVIDEFSRRGETEWSSTVMLTILTERYNRGDRDTLLIDNIKAVEVEACLGLAMASRMQETGGIIEANWPSYRSRKP